MTPLGLYLHVPFCRCKCSWCAFASEEGAAGSDPWLQKILVQLASPPVPDARWATAYLGGGTPSLLSPRQLDTLLADVGHRLEPGAEVTFEANPESLTAEHLDVLTVRGVTRISLGIQTFDEEILARHHRPTRRRHLDEARRLTQDWTGSLSLDLICGLAGQTEVGQARDLDEALSWDPDHLSFYSLTVEPGTPLGRRAAAGDAGLPADLEASQWWLDGCQRLEQAGMHRYEVSNFARPGAESAHNGRYWNLDPWWGLGPSAASFLPRPGGSWEYRTETASLADWLAGAVLEAEIPTTLDLAKDRLLSGLRRTSGVPEAPWLDLLPRTLGAWSPRMGRAGGQLFLLPEAFPFLDGFLRAAFSELDERPELR